MLDDSLFADVVLRTAPHPENLATEALRYLLERHPTVWPAVHTFLAGLEFPLPLTLAFKTQAYSATHAIPDLVGLDSEGKERLIVEAKFWAGLTQNQPVTYLGRLGNASPGMVLFIAPGLRFEYLWEKLATISSGQAGTSLGPARTPSELRGAPVNEVQLLALTSWRALLQVIDDQATHTDNFALRADLSCS